MKKVAFVVDKIEKVFSSKPLKGGGYLVARYLIQEFVKKPDVELHIISGKSAQVDITGIEELVILDSYIHSDKNAFLKDVKDFVTGKFDVVLFLTFEAPFENVLLQAHSEEYKLTNTKNKIQKFFIKNLFSRRKIERNKLLFTHENKQYFAVSEKLKADYVQNIGLKPDNVTVVYPGVEINPTNKKSNQIFTFGYPSGTNKNKGIIDLFFASCLLWISGEKFKLNLILGRNKFLQKLLMNLIPISYLKIWDRQIDMTEFYCSSDCILLPSLSESFGLVPLEAAACCVPSVISNTSGVAEIFEDSVNSIIYDKTKFPVVNLYIAMKKMLRIYNREHEKYVELSKNAHIVAQKYNWEKFANCIYSKLC